MKEEVFEISIEGKLKAFKQHLLLNERVILSAKYGEGKTYFLSKFKEQNDNDFFFITLYPIHYSVAPNEDVFEYIKRDILFQLAEQKLLPTKKKVKTFVRALKGAVNIKNLSKFLYSLTNVNLSPITDELEQIVNTYKEDISSEERYLTSFTIQNSIYENDAYTICINKILEGIEKRTVLIIEDLDRIDPAHLFRLLNVFGAHLDRPFIDKGNGKSNKFGFNNIISVLDYDNAKTTYTHFYGNEDSFEGYMRKYFTDQPFRYSIHRAAALKLYDKVCKQLSPYQTANILYDDSKILIEKFNALSIRDIERIFTMEVVEQMKTPITSNIRLSMEMSTNQGIFRLFVYLNRIGCNYQEFCDVLKFLINVNNQTLQNIVAPLFFFHEYPYFTLFLEDSNGRRYSLKEKKDENNVITTIYSEYCNSTTSQYNIYKPTDIWNYIAKCKEYLRDICIMDDTEDNSSIKVPKPKGVTVI